MDLSIEFECPECRTIEPQKVADLSLGRQRSCQHCGKPTELTGHGLEKLTWHLREFFPN